jgi:hypothetical protein
VEAGDPVFKIVESNVWYVVSWMPHEMVQGLSVGMYRQIFLESIETGRFEPVNMRIETLDYHHHDAFVIFRSTRNVTEFIHQRNVNIRATEDVQTGFLVPSSSIAVRRFFRIPLTHVHGFEDNYFVMHRHEDGLQPVPIHITERTYMHVYTLEDSIMLTPGEGLSPVDPLHTQHIISEADIRIVHGIYRATLNFADFTRVFVYDYILIGGTVMLDPARNTNLRQFDSIVIDAAMVRQGQVVR